jgi:hypothetical protein
LRDQPNIAAGHQSMPEPWRSTSRRRSPSGDFGVFKAEFIVGSIVAVIVTIGNLVIGAIVGGPIGEFAFLLGLIADFELLPTIGPILALIPAACWHRRPLRLPWSCPDLLLHRLQHRGMILVPLIAGEVISFRAGTVLFLVMLGFAPAAWSARSRAARWRDHSGLLHVLSTSRRTSL